MLNNFKKIIKIIEYSKLTNIYLLFILIFLNSIFEVLSIGILLPLVGLIVNPDFFLDFKFFFIENPHYDFFKIENFTKKDFSLLIIIFSIIVYLLKFLINIFYSWILQSTKIRYENFIGLSILKNFSTSSNLDFLNLPTSQLLYNINNRVQAVSSSIVYVSNIIVEIFILLIVSAILLYKFFLITLLILTIFLLFITILYSNWKNKITNWSTQRGVGGDKRNANLLDYFNGIREILIYSSHNLFLKDFEKFNKEYLIPQRKILFLNSLPRIILEIIFIFSAFFILFYYILNDLDFEKILISFSLGLVVVIRLLPSVNRLLFNINHYKFTSDAIIKVFRLLELTKQKDKNYEKTSFKNDIVLSKIEFNYPKKEKIFSNLNLTIKKNSKVGIIGKTGSGKTTLIDIITGLTIPSSGLVLVDSNNIKENIKGWTKNISYVPQKIFLFNLSIRQNITFKNDNEEIDEEKFKKILRICNLQEFIDSQNKKEFTIIDEYGHNVSGGQRQKIGIARALFKDSSLLILDESTNALDEQSAQQMIKNLIDIQDKTILMITHNTKNLTSFDQIYKIDNNILENKI